MTMGCASLSWSFVEEPSMNQALSANLDVHATVIEVLPSMGLAWLRDADMREWAVTKSTPGVDLGTLEPGKSVCLHVHSVDGKQFPCGCSA